MVNRIIKFVLLGAVIWFTASILPSISVNDFTSALIAAVVLSLINSFIKPIVKTISLPITLVTLGLFSFVISAGMVLLMDYLIDGFALSSFWWAFPFSLIISVATSVIDGVIG